MIPQRHTPDNVSQKAVGEDIPRLNTRMIMIGLGFRKLNQNKKSIRKPRSYAEILREIDDMKGFEHVIIHKGNIAPPKK